MASEIREFAPAKVNLCLHVTGRRADGYHLLDSLVVFADVGDTLGAAPAAELELEVDGPFAHAVGSAEDNLVTAAARLMGGGVRLGLTKRLPVAAGIGGGSADAAACLRALTRLGRPMPSPEAVLALGADVPVCMAGRPARLRGTGEIVEPLGAWPELNAVLVNPGVPLATPAVFAALERRENPPLDWPPRGDVLVWLADQRNDLEPAARALEPRIGDVLDALRGAGAQLARMSGSGATCFGVFPTPEAAARAAEALRRPGWWVAPARLHGTGP